MTSKKLEVASKNTKWSSPTKNTDLWSEDQRRIICTFLRIFHNSIPLLRRKLQISGDSPISSSSDHLPFAFRFPLQLIRESLWLISVWRQPNLGTNCILVYDFGSFPISTWSSQLMAPALLVWISAASMLPWSSSVRSFVLLLLLLLFQKFIEINGLLSHPQIKSRNAIRCVSLKSIPYLVWLGCWSFSQVIYIYI